MTALVRSAVIVMFILPLLTVNSKAQSTSAQIQELKRQMEEIQKQNEAQMEELRQKIRSLEVQKQADKEQLEALKEEDEDAWWKKIKMEYKKPGDGFTISTEDGNFKLRTRLRTQFQFLIDDVEDEDTRTEFDVRRLRVTWDGNAFAPWLKYVVQIDGEGGTLSLRDAYLDFAYNTQFAPRVGQYKVPYSREELNSSSELQLLERSIVNDEFAFGRDRGASLYGVFGQYITYGVGVFNGDGRNGGSADSNLLYTARVMITPCCGELKYGGTFPSGGDYKIEPNFGEDFPLFALGLGAAIFPGLNTAVKTPDNDIDERFDEIFAGDPMKADVYSFTVDANFKYSIFSIEGEYQLRFIEPEESGFEEATDQGFRIQAGLFLLPEFVEVAGRFAYISYDDDIDGRESRYEITPGLNFYLSKSHKYKVQLSYSFLNEEETDGTETDENVFRAQLQLYF